MRFELLDGGGPLGINPLVRFELLDGGGPLGINPLVRFELLDGGIFRRSRVGIFWWIIILAFIST